jgi:hypothetical protein
LGIGDWGLGIGDWGLGPNPQSPIPNPQKITSLFEIWNFSYLRELKIKNFYYIKIIINFSIIKFRLSILKIYQFDYIKRI